MITWDPMHKKNSDAIRRCFNPLIGLLVLLTLMSGCTKAPEADTPVTYRITVQSETQEPLQNVKVFVYEDAALQELVSVAATDAEGSVSFTEKPGMDFAAVLKETPPGYEVEESYGVSQTETQIVLSERPLTQEEMEQLRYTLGDKMADFTVNDCDGTAYTLSDLLEQKQAVVLNFWFLKCEPCRMEFPYLQKAYEVYSDSVAFLALNPLDGTDATVAAYRTEQALTLPMASCSAHFQNMLGLTAYPTTVIVDRNGVICLKHVGMFTDSTALENALAYFTQDTYEQRVFETIEEIPPV